MTAEEWRTVAGFPDYQVSSVGRVVSYKRQRPRELAGVVGTSGYQKVTLAGDREKSTKHIHVLVCEAFHGPRPEGMWVRHLDGNKGNNAAANLAWGTPAENAADTRKHGTHMNGRKTHCLNGHPLAGGNVYYSRRGYRNCRTCGRAQVSARYFARKAQAAEAPSGRVA